MTKKTITLLIPAYNEELVLPQLFTRLQQLADNNAKYHFKMLFVNDGSRDQTLSIIKEYSKTNPAVSYINLSRNYGKEIAMAAGINNATSDALIIIDADLQDPPELIPEMIAIWESGYDDVYARRKSRKGESWLKKLTSNTYYKVLQRATNIPIQQDTGDFRLLDKKCILALQQIHETNRNTKALFSWIGYKKKEILYDRDERAAGATKWSYLKLVNLALDGITSFTTAPLRIATILGSLVSLGALVYIVFLLIRTLLFGSDLAGYPSTMVAILFLGGAQLLALGIIGEYLARVYTESKNRPLYFIDEIHLSSE